MANGNGQDPDDFMNLPTIREMLRSVILEPFGTSDQQMGVIRNIINSAGRMLGRAEEFSESVTPEPLAEASDRLDEIVTTFGDMIVPQTAAVRLPQVLKLMGGGRVKPSNFITGGGWQPFTQSVVDTETVELAEFWNGMLSRVPPLRELNDVDDIGKTLMGLRAEEELVERAMRGDRNAVTFLVRARPGVVRGQIRNQENIVPQLQEHLNNVRRFGHHLLDRFLQGGS